MSSSLTPRIAIIGLGGYAVWHHEAVRQLERSGEARLVCTCDPVLTEVAGKGPEWSLAARGIAVYPDYRAMLDRHGSELDVVIIPTPIALHAEMHREAVRRGLAVYLEKPPTLDPVELEQMIECDAAAPVPTLVGFNFIAEPLRQALKHRLYAGEFGELRAVRLLGLWPRSSAYYGRNGWAGRLVGYDGRLVLDSCVGNGLSHHVHNVLYWAAEGAERWARPTQVRAWLARANPIQGADTFFIEARTDTGVPVRMALSHACHGPEQHRETLVCADAEIDYVTKDRVRIRWRDGRLETLEVGDFDAQVENLRALLACLRGERKRPPTTLADCRAFVELHALAYLSAGAIQTVPETEIVHVTGQPAASEYCSLKNIRETAERFLAEGGWPLVEPRPAGPAEIGGFEPLVRCLARLAEAELHAEAAG